MTYTELAQKMFDETKEALQTVYGALNNGQKQQIVKDTKVKALFERYSVTGER